MEKGVRIEHLKFEIESLKGVGRIAIGTLDSSESRFAILSSRFSSFQFQIFTSQSILHPRSSILNPRS